MKKLLLSLFLQTISLFAVAQNYSCFVPDTIQYYTNNDGYVRAIRIDSVHTVGGDIIYFPFKTPRGQYENQQWQPAYLDSTGGSWVGGKVIERSNGVTLFDNYWGDTVTVTTQATLGQQWIFYQHFGSLYSYKAEVIAVDTMSFLGYTDSVKKIRIAAYDGNNLNTADSMHGFEFVLSKTHGFVQTFDMFLFPYHPHDSVYQSGRDYYLDKVHSGSLPGRYKALFKIADYRYKGAHYQYSWSVDDIYQYRQCNYTCWQQYPMASVFLDTIEQVNYSGDTAQYISSGWRKGVAYFPYNIFYVFHQNVPMLYSGLLQHVYTSRMPEEKYQRYCWYFYPNDNTFCSATPRYRFYSNNLLDEMYVHTFEAGHFYADYKDELGLVYYYIFHGGGVIEESERQLTFYNRNGVTCGGFEPVSVTRSEKAFDLAKIFPNPASEELILEMPVDNYDISMVNAIGQVVLTKKCKSRQTIDISQLPHGIYYIKVQLKDQSTITKKVIVQH